MKFSGFVIEFFSYPVIAGFTCAASVQIGSSQIKSLFGISGKAESFLDAWEAVFSHLDQIQIWDTVLGLVSIVLLIIFKVCQRATYFRFYSCFQEIQKFGSLKYRQDWSRNRNIFGIFIFMVSLARNALIVIISTVISYNLRKSPPFKLTGKSKIYFENANTIIHRRGKSWVSTLRTSTF